MRVFILAGQSNMVGYGGERTIDDLANHAEHGHLLAKIKNEDGSWATRNDVFVYFDRGRDFVKAPLTVGHGAGPDRIGPELMFGTMMGEFYKEPVLLIKAAWGGTDLYCDWRPPSAGQPEYSIPTRDGKERELGARYRAMVADVKKCLNEMETSFPQLKGHKPEISGFVWFQGFNEQFAGKDIQEQVYAEYASNYAHMIADLEKEFGLESLPSIVGEMGCNGLSNKTLLRPAQAAVMDQPSLKGKVKFVKTAQYWDPDLDKLY